MSSKLDLEHQHDKNKLYILTPKKKKLHPKKTYYNTHLETRESSFFFFVFIFYFTFLCPINYIQHFRFPIQKYFPNPEKTPPIKIPKSFCCQRSLRDMKVYSIWSWTNRHMSRVRNG